MNPLNLYDGRTRLGIIEMKGKRYSETTSDVEPLGLFNTASAAAVSASSRC